MILEGDAQNVVNALHRGLPRGLHNQVIVNNIISSLSKVESVSFSFCFREAKNVAHRS